MRVLITAGPFAYANRETGVIFIYTAISEGFLLLKKTKPLLLFEGKLCLIKIDFHVVTQEK